MSTLVNYIDIRDYVVNYLRECFASRKTLTVKAHPGQFDEAEIRRLYQKTPALLTSLMGVTQKEAGDNQRLAFVSWLLLRANNTDALYDEALRVLSVLVPLLIGIDAEWSVGGAEKIEAKNLYSSSKDSINVTLWAVYWEWPLRGCIAFSPSDVQETVGGILLPTDLENFEGFDSVHQVGGDEVEDSVNL